MAWLSGWNYRRSINISNIGSSITDYQIETILDTASLITGGKMLSNCNDIRLTDTDGSTVLNHWLESGCNSASTKIWIKIPSIPTGTKTIYLYYGNSIAANISDPFTTFDFFEDFEDGIWNDRWEIHPFNDCGPSGTFGGQTITESFGQLHSNGVDNDRTEIRSIQNLPGRNYIIETRYRYSWVNTCSAFGFGITSTAGWFYCDTVADEIRFHSGRDICSNVNALVIAGIFGNYSTTIDNDTTNNWRSYRLMIHGMIAESLYGPGLDNLYGYMIGNLSTDISAIPFIKIYLLIARTGIDMEFIRARRYTSSEPIISISSEEIYICPTITKYEGDTIHLSATPKDGIGPYYVEFKKNVTPIASYSNSPENTEVTYDYILTNEDIRTATLGTINFSVYIEDSCPISQTCNQLCTITIGCIAPVCNFRAA